MSLKILWLENKGLYSSKRAIQAGRELGIQVDNLAITDLSFITNGKSIGIFNGSENVCNTYDDLIMRTFSPHISEALTVARLFKDAGKVVIDLNLTEEGYSISKMHDYLILAENGIPVPRTWQFFDSSKIEDQIRNLNYPFILKGIHGAEGKNVHKIENRIQFDKIISEYEFGELLFQEYIPAEEDFRLMVVGYKALSLLVKRKPAPGEFRTNFNFNEEVIPLSTNDFPELREIAEKSARILKREFTGIDIRFTENRPMILEVHRRPGFKQFEEITKLDVAEEFIKYVSSKCRA
ncbi:Alpha-aminoadipate--LysW ligase LysX [uncultured archaeon]|nr:Alpha-aminoadipate--LysW ligase LysX [uncultured archaeon]